MAILVARKSRKLADGWDMAHTIYTIWWILRLRFEKLISR